MVECQTLTNLSGISLRNRVRIIGGEWRSRQLQFPDATDLRPTPDSVRETLFNWLGQRLDGKTCLDLFAGSGALGFEALSRGAVQVVMVEKSKRVLEALRANATLLKAENSELVCADALKFLAQDTRRFDVIFLDPPYRHEMLPKLLPLVLDHLAPDGVVYAEDGSPVELPAGWEFSRSGRSGMAHYYLLRRNDA